MRMRIMAGSTRSVAEDALRIDPLLLAVFTAGDNFKGAILTPATLFADTVFDDVLSRASDSARATLTLKCPTGEGDSSRRDDFPE